MNRYQAHRPESPTLMQAIAAFGVALGMAVCLAVLLWMFMAVLLVIGEAIRAR